MASQLKDKTQVEVFNIIASHRSIPFLDLLNVTNIEERRLQAVLVELEKQNLVKVSGRGDVINEYVTLAGVAALGAH